MAGHRHMLAEREVIVLALALAHVVDDERQAIAVAQIRDHADNMEFFKAGITQIIKLWLKNGCKESPEVMFEIIKSEYHGRDKFFADKSME